MNAMSELMLASVLAMIGVGQQTMPKTPAVKLDQGQVATQTLSNTYVEHTPETVGSMVTFYSRPSRVGVLCRVSYLRLAPERDDRVASKFDAAGTDYFYPGSQSCPKSSLDRALFEQVGDADPNPGFRALLDVITRARSQASQLPFLIKVTCPGRDPLQCGTGLSERNILASADPTKVSALVSYDWEPDGKVVSQFVIPDAERPLLWNIRVNQERVTKPGHPGPESAYTVSSVEITSEANLRS